MLGILGEHTHNDRAKRLLVRFVNVMADITNNLDPQEISTPIQRGLTALSKLNIQEAQDLNGVNGIGKKDSDDVAAIITPSSSDDHDRSPYSVLVCCHNIGNVSCESRLITMMNRTTSFGARNRKITLMLFDEVLVVMDGSSTVIARKIHREACVFIMRTDCTYCYHGSIWRLYVDLSMAGLQWGWFLRPHVAVREMQHFYSDNKCFSTLCS